MRINWNFKILNVLNILTFQNVFQVHYYASIAKLWSKRIFVDVVVFSCNAKGPPNMRILGFGKNRVSKICISETITKRQFPHLPVKWICVSANRVSGGPPVWKNCWAGMNYHCVKYFKHNASEILRQSADFARLLCLYKIIDMPGYLVYLRQRIIAPFLSQCWNVYKISFINSIRKVICCLS